MLVLWTIIGVGAAAGSGSRVVECWYRQCW